MMEIFSATKDAIPASPKLAEAATSPAKPELVEATVSLSTPIQAGVACIKSQYLVPCKDKMAEMGEFTAKTRSHTPETSASSVGLVGCHVASVSGSAKRAVEENPLNSAKKHRGMNKSRPRMKKQPLCNKLCRYLWAATREELLEAEKSAASQNHSLDDNNGSIISSVNGDDGCNDKHGLQVMSPANVGNRGGERDTRDKTNCQQAAKSVAFKHPLCPFPGCIQMHDTAEFLNNKLPDLGDECYNFKTFGFCRYGVICRYGSKHINDGYNICNLEQWTKLQPKTTKASLPKTTVEQLRKKLYNFCKADEALALAQQQQHQAKSSNSTPSRIGPAPDDDLIKLRPEEKKKVCFRDQLYLAPLSTLGNLPFRRICTRLGADITCGEMAVSRGLLNASGSEWALTNRHSSEKIFGVQLCGSVPALMVKASELLKEFTDMDFVDINCGCPLDMIFKEGAGSALLRRDSALELMVRGMSVLLPCPVTVKMRASISNHDRKAHLLAPACYSWGAGLVTVHGRSREQRYTKCADWEYIGMCARLSQPNPLFGCGDILNYEDYEAALRTPVAGVMIGRGALMKPWIFTEIKERRNWDISSSQRFEILREFVNYGLEHWGSDTEGVEKTRRFLLEWLSFLYRYIPIGLLERPPQHINQKPPKYTGRDHLESLMASKDCRDWVKISTMLLGPVPDDFMFIPKHKANAWTG